MNKQLKASLLALALIALFLPYLVLAQGGERIAIGQKVNLHSNILKEDRVLWIHAPDTSNNPGARYPLMILLDGDYNFIHTTGILEFLAGVGRVPEMILVGIESTDRFRDFTPVVEPAWPTSGHASMFIRFVTDELLPYVESHYPTASFRIVIGHSIGGSFVLHTLFTNPRLFNAYFILSPNLWWASDTLVTQAGVFLRKTPKLEALVFETHTTQESPKNIAATSDLRNAVESSPVEGLDWKIQYMPNESHSSIIHRSIYDGLESLFAGWEIRGDVARLGMSGVQAHFQQLSQRYGYAIEPPEDLVNGLGYEALRQGKFDEAIAIFRWNVQYYPKSSNAYDSLGEAYAKKGEKNSAIENYEKSIELNPKNTVAIETVRKLKSKQAP